MSGYHAKLSPSGASRWAFCTASPTEQVGLPDNSTEVTRWGTACHLLASTALETEQEPSAWLGTFVRFCRDGDGDEFEVLGHKPPEGGEWTQSWPVVPIDQEQVDCATTYVEFVRNRVTATGGELLVEQKLPIGHITGEPGATGTGDTVILVPEKRRIEVIDLKGGYGYVSAGNDVDGPNLQLAMYALGALEEYALFGEFDEVLLVIVQPRINSISEHLVDVAELQRVSRWLSERAEATRTNPQFAPSQDACHFCRAKATCKPLQAHALSDMPVLDSLPATIDSVVSIERLFEKRDLIRNLLDAVEMHIRNELSAGRPVTGWKLVEGRTSARSWTDDKAAETMLRETFRLKEEFVYDRTLISPTQAEKLKKDGTIGSRQWPKLEALIDATKRNKPSIVPDSDKRPALALASDMPDLDSTDLFV